MVIVDEYGNVLEKVDLTKGYLVDAEWVDHPAVKQMGHYEYANANGGRVQTFVVDTPASGAWREVTKRRYVPYTAEELEVIEQGKYGVRLDALEAQTQAHDDLLTAIEEGIADA